MKLEPMPTGSFVCGGCGAGYKCKTDLFAHFDRGHPTLTVDELNIVLAALDYDNSEAARKIENKIRAWREGEPA